MADFFGHFIMGVNSPRRANDSSRKSNMTKRLLEIFNGRGLRPTSGVYMNMTQPKINEFTDENSPGFNNSDYSQLALHMQDEQENGYKPVISVNDIDIFTIANNVDVDDINAHIKESLDSNNRIVESKGIIYNAAFKILENINETNFDVCSTFLFHFPSSILMAMHDNDNHPNYIHIDYAMYCGMHMLVWSNHDNIGKDLVENNVDAFWYPLAKLQNSCIVLNTKFIKSRFWKNLKYNKTKYEDASILVSLNSLAYKLQTYSIGLEKGDGVGGILIDSNVSDSEGSEKTE